MGETSPEKYVCIVVPRIKQDGLAGLLERLLLFLPTSFSSRRRCWLYLWVDNSWESFSGKVFPFA